MCEEECLALYGMSKCKVVITHPTRPADCFPVTRREISAVEVESFAEGGEGTKTRRRMEDVRQQKAKSRGKIKESLCR